MSKNKIQEQIADFIYLKRRLMLFLAFVVALVVPISSTRVGNLMELTDRSVMKWVVALNNFFANQFRTFAELIDIGIERTILFFQEMVDFYYQLIQFKFDAVTDAGYLLTVLYFIIPILVLYSIAFFVMKKLNRAIFVSILTPKKLILVLLFIPFTDDFLWIGAIAAILLGCFWFLHNLRQEKSEN